MGNTLNNKKANGLALLPFLVFIVVYMGAGLVYQSKGVDMAFYQFPSVTAMFLAVLVAFIMFKGSINEKFDTFAKGAANVDVLTMLIIYILAGAFATVAAEMGGRDATVNLGLSLVPVQFLAAGLFVIAAFMGTATGTSMGTISAITPIAVGVAEKGGLNMMVVLGAVIGGAMFGDNLSMISDTTIAATRSQHCEMRDKFRVNFLTALPAALVTIVVLLIVGRPETVTEIGDLSYSFIKVIPYLLVLILALVGMNVFLVLTIGIFAAGIVGIATGAIATLIPERPFNLDRDVVDRMKATMTTGKHHFIVVVAEGVGNSKDMCYYIQQRTGVETRLTVLGHVQRGGDATAMERVYASAMGYRAIELLEEGVGSRIVGVKENRIYDIDIDEALAMKKDINELFYKVAREISI